MRDSELPCTDLGLSCPPQVEDLWGRLSVVVLPVREDPSNSVRVAAHCELAIGPESVVDLGHPGVWNEHGNRDLDLGVEPLPVHVTPGHCDGLFEQLHVRIEAHGLDVAMLCLSQQCP